MQTHDLKLEIETSPAPEEEQVVWAGLRRHNGAQMYPIP
jgi:hypothetical protein